jgi:hypothetical protein
VHRQAKLICCVDQTRLLKKRSAETYCKEAARKFGQRVCAKKMPKAGILFEQVRIRYFVIYFAEIA